VEDEVEIVLQVEHDPLSEAAESGHPFSRHRRDRRIERPQEKRARETHSIEPPAEDARLESRQVRRDVRKLRHAGENSRESALGAAP
jgi:hypothetical protein